MPTVTAQDLLKQDPKRFREEYLKWTEYALDYDWWDYMEENFKTDMALKGISVRRIWFNVSHCQSDYAAFEGSIAVDEWMVHKGYDVTYPALYLAVKDYCEFASVECRGRGGRARVSFEGYLVGNTPPTGIFAGLEPEAWDELIEEQYASAGLEDEMQSDVDAISDELYTDLRDEYEHLTSEESFIESCECNEITFEIEECEA
jgi:hypothetical protein